MQSFVYLAYAFILFILLAMSSFIIYHLIKYSINAELNRIMLVTFIVITFILLISNILLFSSIHWTPIFGQAGLLR